MEPESEANMLFAIGTKVHFRYTGESGVVTALLGEGMLQIRLDSNPEIEIPAFEEDLTSEAEPVSSPGTFQSIPAGKAVPPPRREIKSGYHILKPKGLQLVFEPMPGRDGSVSRYNTWLINDTPQEFLFELEIYSPHRDIIGSEGKSSASTALELGILPYDDLNETPEVSFSVRRITTEGPGKPVQNHLKIRPKQFFNNFQTVPILNLPAHRFLLFDPAASPSKTEDAEDLIHYTREKVRSGEASRPANPVLYRAFNIEEFAQFVPEIDLHIENLMQGYARLDKGEIIRIQLLHFQRFIDKSIRLGVPRVFVIHGVGEGKLREAIAARLRENPEVAKFKNEFHHKYGYGATEVIFH